MRTESPETYMCIYKILIQNKYELADFKKGYHLLPICLVKFKMSFFSCKVEKVKLEKY